MGYFSFEDCNMNIWFIDNWMVDSWSVNAQNSANEMMQISAGYFFFEDCNVDMWFVDNWMVASGQLVCRWPEFRSCWALKSQSILLVGFREISWLEMQRV